MRICCLSDLHGHLPELPKGCDLYLCGGDISLGKRAPDDVRWYHDRFQPWVKEQGNGAPFLYVAGNHDRIFAQATYRAQLQIDEGYLQDSGWQHPSLPLSVYGMPWSLTFGRWWWMCEEITMGEKLDNIDKADILIVHAPPFGIGDVGYMGEHAGSFCLRDWIVERQPKLVVVGHIHEGYGVYSLGKSIVVNASLMDNEYRLSRSPIVLDLEVES